MASNSDDESVGSIAALFDEGARLFDNWGSHVEHTSPRAGKTPTKPSRVMDLATEVDGGSGTQHIYSSSSQGRLVLFIHARKSRQRSSKEVGK